MCVNRFADVLFLVIKTNHLNNQDQENSEENYIIENVHPLIFTCEVSIEQCPYVQIMLRE